MEDPRIMGGAFDSIYGGRRGGGRLLAAAANACGGLVVGSSGKEEEEEEVGGGRVSDVLEGVRREGGGGGEDYNIIMIGEDGEHRSCSMGELRQGDSIMGLGLGVDYDCLAFPPPSARNSLVSCADTSISVGSSISAHLSREDSGGAEKGRGGQVLCRRRENEEEEEEEEEERERTRIRREGFMVDSNREQGERVEALSRAVIAEAILSARKARAAKAIAEGVPTKDPPSAQPPPLSFPTETHGVVPVAVNLPPPPAAAAAKTKRKLATLFGK